MPTMATKRISSTFALLAVACIAATYMLLFKAGCTGDPKGGAWGDPSLALHLESLSLILLVVGLASGSYAAWSAAGPATTRRCIAALATFCVGGALLWLSVFLIEMWGTQACRQLEQSSAGKPVVDKDLGIATSDCIR